MADFLQAFNITIVNEDGRDQDGAYTNDQDDPGGETKWGICKRYHPDADIENLTKEQAMEIYRTEYWNKILGDGIINQDVANKFFDAYVNPGSIVVKFMQRAVADCVMNETMLYPFMIKVDGMMGPNTLKGINGSHPPELLASFKQKLIDYYKQNGNPKYLQGWLNRIARMYS